METIKLVSRTLLTFSLLLLWQPFPVFAGSQAKKINVEEQARDAYVWGYPAVLMEKAREAMLESTQNPPKAVNHLFHSRRLEDPFYKEFFTVNTDSLYTWGWLDLSKEPIIITQPEMKDRHFIVQLVDAYSNVFQSLNSTNIKGTARNFIITPPEWKGTQPENTVQVKAPTPHIFLFAQTYVRDAQDATKTFRVISQYNAIPLSEWNMGKRIEEKMSYKPVAFKVNRNMAPKGLEFYNELAQIVNNNPPPTKADRKQLENFLSMGFKAEPNLDGTVTPEAKVMIDRGAFQAEREIDGRLNAGFGAKINGWSYEMKSAPDSNDYLTRAAVARKSLFSPLPEDSVEMVLDADSESRQLNSSYRYVLRFDQSDLPPTRAYWSITAYDLKTKNIVSSPNLRASLNDRSGKMKTNEAGMLDIFIQSDRPEAKRVNNWLPLPANSNFYVVLKIYNPDNTVMNRKYVAPSLVRLDESGIPKQRITRTMMARKD